MQAEVSASRILRQSAAEAATATASVGVTPLAATHATNGSDGNGAKESNAASRASTRDTGLSRPVRTRYGSRRIDPPQDRGRKQGRRRRVRSRRWPLSATCSLTTGQKQRPPTKRYQFPAHANGQWSSSEGKQVPPL